MAPSGAHRSEAEPPRLEGGKFRATARNDGARACLLYTSDAADE